MGGCLGSSDNDLCSLGKSFHPPVPQFPHLASPVRGRAVEIPSNLAIPDTKLLLSSARHLNSRFSLRNEIARGSLNSPGFMPHACPAHSLPPGPLDPSGSPVKLPHCPEPWAQAWKAQTLPSAASSCAPGHTAVPSALIFPGVLLTPSTPQPSAIQTPASQACTAQSWMLTAPGHTALGEPSPHGASISSDEKGRKAELSL